MDYKVLNKHPIPVVDEVLDKLFCAGYFSNIDLKSAYYQICMKEDIHKTILCTHEDHYQNLVTPFGLMNPPVIFQCVMNAILKPLTHLAVR